FSSFSLISNSTKLLNKIMQLTIPLKNIAKIRCGTSKTGFSKKIVSKKTYQNLPISAMKNYIPILNSSDIGKYTFNEYKYIPITEFSCNSLNSFKDNRKLFMARMTLQVRVVANDENVSCGKVNVIYDISHEVNHLFLLGVLNSRLITYYYTEKHKNSHLSGGFLSFDTVTVGEIPIKLDSKYYTKISDLVLTAMINNNEDVLKKIDNLVYDLYDLTPEEISLIESK
ncbi:MAG: hypothetical protein ORN24_06480, partial [Burkholderiales bacterium]|nr:hypothetical protein [Burkholderiales bacterium]